MIRYRLNPHLGYMMRAYPSLVTLLQLVGAGLLITGFTVEWLMRKAVELELIMAQSTWAFFLMLSGSAVLLIVNGLLLLRFLHRVKVADSFSQYRQLRLIERQTHKALKDSATANRKVGSKFIDVSKAHAYFSKQSRRITVTIHKLADQTTDDLEKFADMLSACLVGKNRSLIVLDYWLSEDNTEFVYLLDSIDEAQARQLKPKRITELKPANDYEITVEADLNFSMLKNIHLLLVGNTSSSKTTFLKSMLAQVFMFESEVDLTIFDVKSEFSSWDFLDKGTIISDSDEILTYFETLLDLVINREKEIAQLAAREDITGATFVNFGQEMRRRT